jgi:hypothetical protein
MPDLHQDKIDMMVDKYLDRINKYIADPLDHYTYRTLNPQLESFCRTITLCMYIVSFTDEDGNKGQLIGYFDESRMVMLLLEFDGIFDIIWKREVKG